MTAQVVCEECCRSVPEDKATVAEDGREVCLACASAETEECRSAARTSQGGDCCESACQEAAPVVSKAELAPPRPEPCGWEDNE